jgi:hypothetical protein
MIQVRFIRESMAMAKRRGNPSWGKSVSEAPVIVEPTSFDRAVERFNLAPDQYVNSPLLREWACRNKNSKYIPEALIKAWGLE